MGLLSAEKRMTLVSCLGAYFLSMAMIYQMSPFFQMYARETCGASTATVGLIFAAMPSACFARQSPMDAFVFLTLKGVHDSGSCTVTWKALTRGELKEIYVEATHVALLGQEGHCCGQSG
ncbi:unnamed protein product [Effrenium voratum]|uniref:Uncharacterized protein n=1 Tax=Effrenium voratum TaxID=2562239 RepID=A0AA36JG56_9DINO|nr:unnamed protein product [Effrenium voratum]